MLYLEKEIEIVGASYLSPIETNWQPGDLLPASSSASFFDDVKIEKLRFRIYFFNIDIYSKTPYEQIIFIVLLVIILYFN